MNKETYFVSHIAGNLGLSASGLMELAGKVAFAGNMSHSNAIQLLGQPTNFIPAKSLAKLYLLDKDLCNVLDFPRF